MGDESPEGSEEATPVVAFRNVFTAMVGESSPPAWGDVITEATRQKYLQKGVEKTSKGMLGLNLEPLHTSLGLLDRARDRGRICFL